LLAFAVPLRRLGSYCLRLWMIEVV
jgi:hypothetical protein